LNQDQDCHRAVKRRPRDHCIVQHASEVGCAGPTANGCDQKIPRCHRHTVEISGLPDEWRGICYRADGGDRNKIVLDSFSLFLQEGALDLGFIPLYLEGKVEHNVEGHMRYKGR